MTTPTAYPLLSRHLATGDIILQDGTYLGMTWDGVRMAMPGWEGNEEETERYLSQYPTPGHW